MSKRFFNIWKTSIHCYESIITFINSYLVLMGQYKKIKTGTIMSNHSIITNRDSQCSKNKIIIVIGRTIIIVKNRHAVNINTVKAEREALKILFFIIGF